MAKRTEQVIIMRFTNPLRLKAGDTLVVKKVVKKDWPCKHYDFTLAKTTQRRDNIRDERMAPKRP